MPGADVPFSCAEYADGLARVRAAMDAAGLDVMVCADPSNMAWLTGYDGWSSYVHQAVIVGPSGDPVFWGRKMDAIGAGLTAYMGAEDIVGYPDHYVMSTALRPDMTFHFMPGLWADEWGLEITETLRIREDGPAECLASVPREMVVKR